ncbi:sialoadhesin-like [Colossoma macropomum]|uniref:sialoadhesin-like n=1 Tax=Colossoma macropomum TaxID=42526 RepID=UPI0018645287|nr:sialoadhesin-like [Colossoma macropomum]
MNNLTKSDSGEYRFRLITDTAGGSFSGYPGVILSVTDLQVKMSPTTPSEGQTVTLTCISTCTLPNNTPYIWYKNGQPVTNKPTRYNKLYLESANTEDVLQYSCALGGSEESTVLMFITVGVSVFLALILITVSMWRCSLIRRKRKAVRDADVQTTKPRDDTYSALNPTTMSSDYDTLTHLRDSPSDTYTALYPTTMSSDYDTLTVQTENTPILNK